MRSWLAVFLLVSASPWPASALVVEGPNEATSTSAPATNDFGFANVARVFDTADGFFTSGVYLGNGWLLTAYHAVRDAAHPENPLAFSFGQVLLASSSY